MRSHLLLPAALTLLLGCSSSGGGADSPSPAMDVLNLRDDEVRQAGEALVRSLRKRALEGWPASLPVDAQGNPALVIESFSNRTTEHMDMVHLRGLLEDELVGAGFRLAPADPATAKVLGSVTDQVTRTEERTTKDFTISLRVLAPDGGVVATAVQRYRKVREN